MEMLSLLILIIIGGVVYYMMKSQNADTMPNIRKAYLWGALHVEALFRFVHICTHFD